VMMMVMMMMKCMMMMMMLNDVHCLPVLFTRYYK
jgi:hypothetical protein